MSSALSGLLDESGELVPPGTADGTTELSPQALFAAQRAVVEFLVREGKDGPARIGERLKAAYGPKALSRVDVDELYDQFFRYSPPILSPLSAMPHVGYETIMVNPPPAARLLNAKRGASATKKPKARKSMSYSSTRKRSRLSSASNKEPKTEPRATPTAADDTTTDPHLDVEGDEDDGATDDIRDTAATPPKLRDRRKGIKATIDQIVEMVRRDREPSDQDDTEPESDGGGGGGMPSLVPITDDPFVDDGKDVNDMTPDEYRDYMLHRRRKRTTLGMKISRLPSLAADANAVRTAEEVQRRRRYSIMEKLAVIEFMKENSKAEAARLFDIDDKTLRIWRNKEEDLKAVMAKKGLTRSRLEGGGRKVKYVELETRLVDYIKQQRKEGVKITHRIIKNRALDLFDIMRATGMLPANETFQASEGWLKRFLERNFNLGNGAESSMPQINPDAVINFGTKDDPDPPMIRMNSSAPMSGGLSMTPIVKRPPDGRRRKGNTPMKQQTNVVGSAAHNVTAGSNSSNAAAFSIDTYLQDFTSGLISNAGGGQFDTPPAIGAVAVVSSSNTVSSPPQQTLAMSPLSMVSATGAGGDGLSPQHRGGGKFHQPSLHHHPGQELQQQHQQQLHQQQAGVSGIYGQQSAMVASTSTQQQQQQGTPVSYERLAEYYRYSQQSTSSSAAAAAAAAAAGYDYFRTVYI